MFFKKKVEPSKVVKPLPFVRADINDTPHRCFDGGPCYHYEDDLFDTHPYHEEKHNPEPELIRQVSVFDSPVVGSAAVFIDHFDDPSLSYDYNRFGIMVDVDNKAFRQAIDDITVYDKDLNVIADKSNIAAIGISVKEDYARPVVDVVDSITSIIRCKYNEIYSLQRNIIDQK